ncbi:hypothetical protein PR048_025177 [Dryococelus australis]|uniref:Uncharacterized protein n=1 Tax=Dryococelus australis TaxID=614101 RepID=A0ABQ9GQN4_9NEOP|nr:hypothetical protein PR048_025177 [Dryococelus australis]
MHHRKCDAAFQCLKKIAFHHLCQKVALAVLLSIYKKQISCYNFGVHINDTSDGIMCVWHEGQASRGGNEIASYLFRAINNLHITHKRE